MSTLARLQLPPHYDPATVGELRQIPYGDLADGAKAWAEQHGLKPAAKDDPRVCLMVIDAQNTFVLPDGELSVGGAVEDAARTCEFIYGNLDRLTLIAPTMDTHTAMQIFHPIFWVDDQGNHPIGGQTQISLEDVEREVWRVNPAVAFSLGWDYMHLRKHALHYVRTLTDRGKYALMVWPYHAMLGGVGHALVPALEEACFFHNLARCTQTQFEIKGGNPLTENYSVLAPEVLTAPSGKEPGKEIPIDQKNTRFLQKLMDFDMVIIAGQAKSHCVAWTIDDLLGSINEQDPDLAKKVYLLEDCTSPVVVPNVVDFTDQGNEAFERFAGAGMHVVQSTTPVEDWPDSPF
jgi:nicotinamidase-related amidase